MTKIMIGKSELAHCYYPWLTIAAARNLLMLQMRSTPGLLEQLRLVGYAKRQKVFYRHQLEIIYAALGTPFLDKIREEQQRKRLVAR